MATQWMAHQTQQLLVPVHELAPHNITLKAL